MKKKIVCYLRTAKKEEEENEFYKIFICNMLWSYWHYDNKNYSVNKISTVISFLIFHKNPHW